MKRDLTIRIPRPLGVTQLMSEYHREKDPNLLAKVQQYLIQQWLLTNGKVCGKVYNIPELSAFIKCDPEMIRIQMRDQFLNTKLWNKEVQEGLMESLIGQHIAWAMEDRMEVDNQVGILRASQGLHYTPFVTAELNKAISMKLSSTNTLGGIIKNLAGGGSINIFNQSNHQENTIIGVSVEKAIEIIQEESKQLEAPQQIQYIDNHYEVDNVEEFPEVVAVKQVSMDTSKEGLNIGMANLAQIADNYKGTLKEFDNEHHQIRREVELGVDLELEDPELDIYPTII